MTEANHASLSYQDGLASVDAVTFGATHFPCVDFFGPCLTYIVTPNSDLLYLFPPPQTLPFGAATYQDLQQLYIDLNLTTVEENTIVVVVGFTFGKYFDLPNPYRNDPKLVMNPLRICHFVVFDSLF